MSNFTSFFVKTSDEKDQTAARNKLKLLDDEIYEDYLSGSTIAGLTSKYTDRLTDLYKRGYESTVSPEDYIITLIQLRGERDKSREIANEINSKKISILDAAIKYGKTDKEIRAIIAKYSPDTSYVDLMRRNIDFLKEHVNEMSRKELWEALKKHTGRNITFGSFTYYMSTFRIKGDRYKPIKESHKQENEEEDFEIREYKEEIISLIREGYSLPKIAKKISKKAKRKISYDVVRSYIRNNLKTTLKEIRQEGEREKPIKEVKANKTSESVANLSKKAEDEAGNVLLDTTAIEVVSVEGKFEVRIKGLDFWEMHELTELIKPMLRK